MHSCNVFLLRTVSLLPLHASLLQSGCRQGPWYLGLVMVLMQDSLTGGEVAKEHTC